MFTGIKSIAAVFIFILFINNFDYISGSIEDERELVASNFPYGRGVDSDQLQLARILLLPQRICHTKRNSEIINSLLGLPKNMNNAGK